jgi:hypothetical protein
LLEHLLECLVADVEQPRVVDDPCRIDIGEPDRNLDTEGHQASFLPGCFPVERQDKAMDVVRDRIRPEIHPTSGILRLQTGLITLPGPFRVGKIKVEKTFGIDGNRP